MLGYFLADSHSRELIHPNDAIKAIKAFVEGHQARADAAKGGERAAALSADRRLGGIREEVEFWSRMSAIISDKTGRVWNVRRRAARTAAARRERGTCGALCAGIGSVPDRPRLAWRCPALSPSARAFNRSQALDKALLKYNQLLASRHAKMSEVSALEGQNNELKALLNQYLASKVGSAADGPRGRGACQKAGSRTPPRPPRRALTRLPVRACLLRRSVSCLPLAR